jgi:hypothetical protein
MQRADVVTALRDRFLFKVIVPALIAFSVTFGAGMMAIANYSTISPVDELQHLDYVLKVSDGQLVLFPGERFGQEAMRIQACRGIDAEFQSPPCSTAVFDPDDFQEAGLNTAAKGYPTPYYLFTGALVVPLQSLGLDGLTAARVASLFVHALGAALVAAAASALATSALLGAGLGTLVGVLPHLLSQGSTANPDAWALVSGAVFVILAVWRHAVPFPLWLGLLTVSTVGLGLTKPNWVLLVVVPFVVVCAQWWSDHASVQRRELVAVCATGFLGVAVLVGSTLWTSRLSVGQPVPPMSQYLAISETNPFDVARAIFTTFRAIVPLDHPPVVDSLTSEPGLGLAFLWGVLFAGASVLAVFSAGSATRTFSLGLSGVLVLLLSPVLVYLGQYAVGQYFEYPQRYSYMAIPIVALGLASWRPTRGTLLGLIGLLSSIAFVALG